LKAQGGEGLSLVHNLQATFWALYAPVGAGPGKGAFDITGAKDVRVTGCRLSALGDTMHIQRCRNIVFANNHIIGSRMGAFFLAEFCQNATITGNLIDGTNGSRVMSVEKSCEDVTITGNTFRNGGRGSWINQPKNFILANNVFVNNTTKGENDLRRGRRSYENGEPRRFPELYFTLHEEDGSYGPVIVRDNVFQLGDSAPDEAVTFAPNGRDLQMSGNTFPGRTITIAVDPSCEAVAIHDNPGAELKRTPIDFNHGRR
jgi:nitrous oxidase accessory protein NosD